MECSLHLKLRLLLHQLELSRLFQLSRSLKKLRKRRKLKSMSKSKMTRLKSGSLKRKYL